MPILHRILTALLLSLSLVNAKPACPNPSPTSCSSEAAGQDPCCVPSPGGLFLFEQKYEAEKGDEGAWSVDGLRVLDCNQNPLPALSHEDRRAFTHEQIGSFLASSSEPESDIEQWEGDWAASEVGEGVEEIWERAWRTGGGLISTLKPQCVDRHQAGHEVPLFFKTIASIQRKLDSWNLLAGADITPSERVTFTRDEIVAALSKTTGLQPFIACNQDTISRIHWPLVSTGPFQAASFSSPPSSHRLESLPPSLSIDSQPCPAEGIRYPPIPHVPPPRPEHTWDPIMDRPSLRPLSEEAIAKSRAGQAHEAAEAADLKREQEEGDQNKAGKLGFFKKAVESRYGGQEKEEGEEVRIRDEL